MELKKGTCTNLLTITSMIVLAITYDILSLDGLSMETSFVSLELSSPNNRLFPVAAVALLLGLLICHIISNRWDIRDAYQNGYRFSPRLMMHTRALIIEASNGIAREPPVGNIHATLFPRTWDLGQFTRPDNTLSSPVLFTPDAATHRNAVLQGILASVDPRLWMPFYCPMIFAIWSLLSLKR